MFSVRYKFNFSYYEYCRSRWPRGLRCGSAATPLLGLRVRIPPGLVCWVFVVGVVCRQVEGSASG